MSNDSFNPSFLNSSRIPQPSVNTSYNSGPVPSAQRFGFDTVDPNAQYRGLRGLGGSGDSTQRELDILRQAQSDAPEPQSGNERNSGSALSPDKLQYYAAKTTDMKELVSLTPEQRKQVLELRFKNEGVEPGGVKVLTNGFMAELEKASKIREQIETNFRLQEQQLNDPKGRYLEKMKDEPISINIPDIELTPDVIQYLSKNPHNLKYLNENNRQAANDMIAKSNGYTPEQAQNLAKYYQLGEDTLGNTWAHSDEDQTRQQELDKRKEEFFKKVAQEIFDNKERVYLYRTKDGHYRENPRLDGLHPDWKRSINFEHTQLLNKVANDAGYRTFDDYHANEHDKAVEYTNKDEYVQWQDRLENQSHGSVAMSGMDKR